MNVIKDLVYVGEDELKDAERAVHLAMKYKGTDNMSAEVFATIAKQKLDNATGIIHTRQVAIIKDFRAKGKEVPSVMQARYDVKHEELMEKALEIGTMIKVFREA